jgi:phosphoserine phosphatase
VGFDWDGTLSPSPFVLLAEELGHQMERNQLEGKWRNGQLAYKDWCKEAIKIFVRIGLTRKRMYEIFDEKFKLHPGAIETIKALKAKGVKTCIVSGGMSIIYDYCSDRFGIEVDYVHFMIKYEFSKDGVIVGGTITEEDKLEMFEKFCSKAGATMDQAVYVGDGLNDVPIFKVCKGIAFAPDSEELKMYAKHIVKGTDMREVLDYID